MWNRCDKAIWAKDISFQREEDKCAYIKNKKEQENKQGTKVSYEWTEKLKELTCGFVFHTDSCGAGGNVCLHEGS